MPVLETLSWTPPTGVGRRAQVEFIDETLTLEEMEGGAYLVRSYASGARQLDSDRVPGGFALLTERGARVAIDY